MSKLLNIIFIAICIFIGPLANAQTIFIQYDENCMDRYEYRYDRPGYNHIAYHLLLNNREKVILEVGVEDKISHTNLPANTVNCQGISLNERMVRQLNDGELQIYIVRRMRGGYTYSPVGIAVYVQISDNAMGLAAVDYRFQYRFNQPANGVNLAASGSASEVYFKGIRSYSCPRQLEFEKINKRAGRNYSRIMMIPEIGIIEEATGFNPSDAAYNRLKLISINGNPLEQYISGYCTTVNDNNDAIISFYSQSANNFSSSTDLTNPNNTSTNDSTGQETNTCTVYKDIDRGLYFDWATGLPAEGECGGNEYKKGLMVSGSSVVTTPVGPTPTTGTPSEYPNNRIHIVKEGETLYSIARTYGTSVSYLKALNALVDDRIIPFMSIRVDSPKNTIDTRVTPASTDLPTATSTPTESIRDRIHIVKEGETIRDVARIYGMSTSQLKALNHLEDDEIIIPFQRLYVNPNNNTVAASDLTIIFARDEHAMPKFDYPPPAPSAFEKLSKSYFKDIETVAGLANHLERILNECGYHEKSYYTLYDKTAHRLIPNSFVLVTKMEKIKADVSPFPPPERWDDIADMDTERKFSLKDYLRSIFFPKKGKFRILVFIVTDIPVKVERESQIEASSLMDAPSLGARSLPQTYTTMSYTPDYNCNVFIYEFDKREYEDAIKVDSRYQGIDHLTKNNFIPYLSSSRR